MTERAAAPQSSVPLGRLPGGLALGGVLLVFAVQASLLDSWGVHYDSPSGAAWEKVHPGTDLLILAVILQALRAGNPLRYLLWQLGRFPGAAALLAATGLLMVYLFKVQGLPFTPFIDTFVMPPLLFLVLVDMPERAHRAIEAGLHVILAVNAVIGIAELTTGWRLIPMTLNGLAMTPEMEWRASGLFGHPLASSATAGMYAVIIALGFGRALPGWLRLPALALQMMALGAFGGRTALVITLICVAVALVGHLADLLAGRRFDRRVAGVAFLLLPILGLAVFQIIEIGFFDQVLDRFVDDNGSAKARAAIFTLFSDLSWTDLLFGPDKDHMLSLQHLEGIEIGVESFWIGMVMNCGLWMSALLFAGLGLFLRDVMRRTDRKALAPLVFYLLVISTTVSLSAKSTSLGMFITMVLVLMPATAPALRRAVPRDHPALVPA